ncbi:MAG: NUDIX hydrolase, partial [Actinobacteria bacterium]|nr:NUDIX hydrolase [Actinomycetota bacterium]
LMVRQYRHPVRRLLWELPAGLCDAPGESREACARRELLEETGHRASALEQLVTTATSPGGSDELLTLFLTYDPVPDAEAYGTQEPEERHMQAAWFPLAEAVEAVRSGKILNGIAQLGISLAALRVRHGVAR